MATIRLPSDFKEFLSLLNSNSVRYLLIGGYAVGYYGHIRTTGDMDVWVEPTHENATRVISALSAFGFGDASKEPAFFENKRNVARMGIPPMRIEVLTGISGVEFSECYERRIAAEIDGIPVAVINLEDLRKNKMASGRPKDLADLDELSG